MYKLIELPNQSNDYLAKFIDINTEEILLLHRREYRGNIALNQIINLDTIKK